MVIAVLSGKGGTGKTTIATNLAWTLSRETPTQLLDADVEEPNSHLFFEIEFKHQEQVFLLLPKVNKDKCTLCGECTRVCQFGAISVFKTGVMVFDSLCHGCGACSIICPTKAISEVPKEIGVVKLGKVDENLSFGMGLLNIGEPSGVRIIRQLKKHIDSSRITIIDAPPGTSCPVVETLREIDFALMITEATPFGLHDLRLAVDVVEKMKIPMGIIVNKASDDYTEVEKFAKEKNIPVLERIPYDRNIAEYYSRGILFTKEDPEWLKHFERLFNNIIGVMQK